MIYSIFVVLIIFFVGCSSPTQSDFFRELTSIAVTAGIQSTNRPIETLAATANFTTQVKTSVPEKCLAESRNDSVNIRNAPSGNIIGCCLAKGERVEIQLVDFSDEWALIKGIEKESHLGWVKASFLKPIGICKMIQIP